MNPAHYLNRSRHYLNITPCQHRRRRLRPRRPCLVPVGQPRRNRRRRPLASSPRHPATPAPVRQSAGVRRPPPLHPPACPCKIKPAAFRCRRSGLCKVGDAALAVPGFPPSQERGITKPPETERCLLAASGCQIWTALIVLPWFRALPVREFSCWEMRSTNDHQ